ncbi:MAG: DUF4276 family protein [Planctomycetes bacterium]|nr:DUF4276 family protein [Planctomycetota bacterium]
MTIVIITEDNKGREPVYTLAKKILSQPNIRIKSDFASKGNLLDPEKAIAKMSPYLRDKDVSKIIVCVDTECTQTSPQKIQDTGRQVAKLISKPPVKYCPVVHALESWLASDPKPITKRLGKIFSLRQDECKPKDFLEQEFKKANKEDSYRYIRENSRIAEEVDITTIEGVNQSFKGFIKALKNP